MKLAVPSVNEGLVPVRLALEQGYFKEEGLDVELVDFRGGGPAVQAFAGGSVDLCICAADHVVRLANRGFDARIIVGLDEHHSYALLSKADQPYTDVSSLKGKRIGVTSPGSLTDNTIRWSIKQAGLEPERDYQIIGAGTGATMRAALETDQVDAATVVSTDVNNYVRTGKFKVVTDWRTIAYPALVIIGRQQWADSHPAAAKAFVRAMKKAAQTIQTDTPTVAKTVKLLFPNFTDEAVQEIAESVKTRLSKDGSVSAEGFETMQQVVLLSDPSLKKVNKTDVDLHPALSN